MMVSALGLEVVVVPAALIGLFGAILAYYLVKLIGSQELEMVWKQEIYESILSVLLMVAIFSVILPMMTAALDRYVASFYGGPLPQIDSPEGRILRGTPLYVVLFRLEQSEKYLENGRRVAMALSSMMKSAKMKYTAGNTPFIGLSFGTWDAITNNIYNNVLNLLYLYLFSKKLFLFIPYVAQIMIPVGVAFRAFPPTRGMGAYLLSFGLTLYLLFPIFFLAFVGPKPPTIYKALFLTFEPILRGLEKTSDMLASFFSSTAGSAVGTVFGVVALASPDFLNLGTLILGGTFLGANFGSIPVIIAKFNELMAAFMVDLLFAPYAAFALALSLINMLTTILGGKMPEIGRGLVKFI